MPAQTARPRKASGTRSERKGASPDSPQVRQLVEELQRLLGTKVRLHDRGGKGVLEVEYYSYEDLDRLRDLLRK